MGKKILILTFVALAFLGCNKNSGGGQPVAPIGPGPGGNWANCQACTGMIRSPFAALVGVQSADVSNEILIALDLIIDGAIPGFPYQDPKAFLYYQGPVAVQGVIRVTQPNDPLVCNVAPGDYQLRPLTVSSAQYGVVSGGSFEAIGPGGRMLIRLGSSQVNNMTDPNGVYNGSPSNRIGLNMYIDQVQGYPYPCGGLSTY